MVAVYLVVSEYDSCYLSVSTDRVSQEVVNRFSWKLKTRLSLKDATTE